MKRGTLLFAVWVTAALLLTGVRPANAQFYTQHNLVSSDASIPAVCIDPNLVNAWGLSVSPTSPWWISDNGTAKTSLYNISTLSASPPCPAFTVFNNPGQPTGQVRNNGTGFLLPNAANVPGVATFILASENGIISGNRGGTTMVIGYDNSASGAVYKGLAIALLNPTAPSDRIYATDFHNNKVDIFTGSPCPPLPCYFTPVVIPGAFTDPDLPAGYAPFGIQNLNGVIYVTYAMQDADAHDDVPGNGHGFVDVFDTAGTLLRRVASRGQLNSPWGLALAPPNFGFFSNNLLVGNFGDGTITAFDPGDMRRHSEYQQSGQFHSADGPPLVIDGLWGLAFGTGSPASGPSNTLFFTAGPGGESHGLFGSLVPSSTHGNGNGKGKDK
jgi:uncharacterized protein (TIGR03118 family)